jgi:hypothetical protein
VARRFYIRCYSAAHSAKRKSHRFDGLKLLLLVVLLYSAKSKLKKKSNKAAGNMSPSTDSFGEERDAHARSLWFFFGKRREVGV